MAKKTAKPTRHQSKTDAEQFRLGVEARKQDAKNKTETVRPRGEPTAWWDGYDYQRSLEK